MPLEILNLSARPYHALSRMGIKTVEELLQMDTLDIMCISNLGAKGRAEIGTALKKRGFNQYQINIAFR